MYEQEMLNIIAKVIEIYEDPTGYNCSNNVGALISIDDRNYEFDGEKFVKLSEDISIEKRNDE